jgi:hypothetical protein
MRSNSDLRSLITSVALVSFVGALAPLALSQDRKPDPVWKDVRKVPSAFPDVKPIIDRKEVEESINKRTVVIFEADPPIRKLRKAKLRNALAALREEFESGHHEERIPLAVEMRLLRLGDSLRDAVSTGIELAADDKEQRAWLVFAVGIWKCMEKVAQDRADVGIIGHETALMVQRDRLDAEIALLRHDQKK